MKTLTTLAIVGAGGYLLLRRAGTVQTSTPQTFQRLIGDDGEITAYARGLLEPCYQAQTVAGRARNFTNFTGECAALRDRMEAAADVDRAEQGLSARQQPPDIEAIGRANSEAADLMDEFRRLENRANALDDDATRRNVRRLRAAFRQLDSRLADVAQSPAHQAWKESALRKRQSISRIVANLPSFGTMGVPLPRFQAPPLRSLVMIGAPIFLAVSALAVVYAGKTG